MLYGEPRDRPPLRVLRALAISGLLVVMILAMVPGPLVPASGTRGASTGSQPATLAAPASPHASGGNCSALSAGYARLDAPYYPAPIAPSLPSGCLVGHDAPGLYFVSNATGSGAQFEVSLALPPSGTSPASAYAAFWVGMWVAGVQCSYDGASYLTVELLPPDSTMAGVASSANWSVVAPVWDLVAPGSCDPQCTNDTAFVTIAGRSFCEDDAVLNGIGSLGGAVTNQFAPGDLLSLTFLGTPGTEPLQLFLNDSSHPTANLSWNYGGMTTGNPVGVGIASGRNLTPFYSTANASNGGWTGGLDVGFGWQNCPSAPSGSGLSACNSYDGPAASVAGAPQVERILSWNATRHGYLNPYPWVATVSSSGACSGLAGTDPCVDFTTDGGTGVYPVYSVDASSGRAWYAYGQADPNAVSEFGGSAVQFPAIGNLSALSTTTVLSEIRTSVSSSAATVTARVSDPYAVGQVFVRDWWCAATAVRAPGIFVATLSSAGGNSPSDGNWSANLPTHGYIGNLYYSITAISNAGSITGPVYGNVTVTGAGTTCGASLPMAPTIVSGSVSAIGGGYSLSWSANFSYWVTSFVVSAAPPGGGSPTFYPLGNVTQARIGGLSGNTSYVLRVAAVNPVGTSPSSASVAGPATYYPLKISPLNVTITSPTTWINQTVVGVRANATGGAPAFTFTFDFGDGTNQSVFTSGEEASVSHPFLHNYSGVARLRVTLADSVGDIVVAPVAYVQVLAGPLAPSASIAGGNGFADIRWSPATPPPGDLVQNYEVFWTTDPAWAPYLTVAWPTNATVPAIHTKSTTIYAVSMTVPNGVEVFAQVVAWDVHGGGLLPMMLTAGEEPVFTATPEPFASPGIVLSAGGGSAPFTENFTTEFTTGTGTVVVNATYSFTGGGQVAAPITGSSGRFWANASYTFPTPGLREVFLYAVDSVSELLLLTASLYVAPAPGPVVSVAVHPTPVFVGAAAQLSASATGGSGAYAYSWDLGNGANASGAAVSASYASAGTYLVRVTATDTIYGGSTEASVLLPVYSTATVQIGVVPTATPGTYALAAFAFGGYGNLTFVWLFGDGTEGSGANLTHTWAVPGVYNLTVRVSDAYGHTSVASTNLTVVYPSGGSSSSGGASLEVTGLLVIAVAILAAVLVALLLRGRKKETPPAVAPGEVYGGETPSPDLEEEAQPEYH